MMLLNEQLYQFQIIKNYFQRNCMPPNKMLTAKFLVCFNFKSASMLLKFVKILFECQIPWNGYG